MRLVVLLCWWNERPDWLYDAVLSAGLIGADFIVACDGAYALVKDGTARSSDEEYDAIRDAARQIDVPLTIHTPTERWQGNELEKRTLMFRMGDEVGADWFCIQDADEVFIRAPEDLKDRLATTEHDYCDVMSHEQPAPVVHAMAEGADWPQIHFSYHVKPRRCLIRAVPGIRVVGSHNQYVCPDGRNLWGDEQGDPLRLKDVMMQHRNAQRSDERHQIALDYYEARTAAGAEPGLRATPPASDEKLRLLNGRLRRGLKNWTPA